LFKKILDKKKGIIPIHELSYLVYAK